MTDNNPPGTPPLGGFGTLPALPGLSLLNGLFEFVSPGFTTPSSTIASGQLGPLGLGQGPVAYGPLAASGLHAMTGAGYPAVPVPGPLVTKA